jgi:hypothetical protein
LVITVDLSSGSTLYPSISPSAMISFFSSAALSALAAGAFSSEPRLLSPFDSLSEQPVTRASDSTLTTAVAPSRAPDDLFMSGL